MGIERWTLHYVDEPRRDLYGRSLGASISGPVVKAAHPVEVVPASQFQGAVDALEQIKAKGDGTWSADRCALEAEYTLLLLARTGGRQP